MKFHTRDLYLALATGVILLSLAPAINCAPPSAPESDASISLVSEVYEINDNAIALFDDSTFETAKQEIYNVTVTNTGELPLEDVIISISSAEGIVFRNLAYYDNAGNLQLECIRSDLCQRPSTSLIRDLGTLEPDESESIFINAYLKPSADNRQIKAKVICAKPNGIVSAIQNNAKLAECILFDSNGIPCAEQKEGCICKRPSWTGVFGAPVNKPLIPLNRMTLTNTIYAIETANGELYSPNSNNTLNIEGYTPSESDHITYLITVSNTDSNNSIKNILVFDEIPDGMIFCSSSITIDGRPNTQIFPCVSGNKITWKINEIKPKTQAIIKHVAAFHRMNDLRRFENRVYANGTWDTEYALIEDQSQVVSSVIPA